MESIMSIRSNVQAVIDGILKGDILGTFDRYYAEDVVMSENGIDARVGKPANRAYEEQFVSNVEFHSAEVGAVVVDGDHAAIEWTLEFTPRGGARMKQRQVALQTWKGGQIVREVFYHA
jgi:ketosteroid isomerase-like protein